MSVAGSFMTWVRKSSIVANAPQNALGAANDDTEVCSPSKPPRKRNTGSKTAVGRVRDGGLAALRLDHGKCDRQSEPDPSRVRIPGAFQTIEWLKHAGQL